MDKYRLLRKKLSPLSMEYFIVEKNGVPVPQTVVIIREEQAATEEAIRIYELVKQDKWGKRELMFEAEKNNSLYVVEKEIYGDEMAIIFKKDGEIIYASYFFGDEDEDVDKITEEMFNKILDSDTDIETTEVIIED